jgi:DNA helicase-2/ATP-dependent DNA helicase PcrA
MSIKHGDIVVGGHYTATIGGKAAVVKVEGFAVVNENGRKSTHYQVSDKETGKSHVFKTVRKFIGIVKGRKADKPKAPARGKPAAKPPADPEDRLAFEEMAPLAPDEMRELITPERVADELRLAEGAVGAPKPKGGFAEKMRANMAKEEQRQRTLRHGPSHVIVKALAGTGKTTTLISALQNLKGLTPTTVVRGEDGAKLTMPITPTPQQRAVWDAVAESQDQCRFVAFVAFNSSIAEELASRVPPGMDAMTMHKLGYRAVNKAFGYCPLDSKRVPKIIEELLEEDWNSLQRGPRAEMVGAAVQLTKLVKMNLVPTDIMDDYEDRKGVDAALQDLVDYYEIEISNGDKRQAFDLVPKIIDRCKEVGKDRKVDFDDMVWLPVALGLPVFQYDLLLVDEAQDLNRCQQALCKKAGRRLLFCGDPHQAIYGFAGADCESMARLAEELGNTQRGCIELPLTMTRRCGKAIVEEARQWVPEFEAFGDNPEGAVLQGVFHVPLTGERPYRAMVRPGDHIICRVTAPLIGECLGFLSEGRKASVLGRDVAASIKATLKRIRAASVSEMYERLDEWLANEVSKETSKKFPSESRIIALHDRAECLRVFMQDAATYEEVQARIEGVFTSNPDEPGIRLSTIHKAKGLEANRVFFLRPKGAGCPHPLARTPWQQAQERNLVYVAITRAIHELVHVA